MILLDEPKNETHRNFRALKLANICDLEDANSWEFRCLFGSPCTLRSENANKTSLSEIA